MTEFADGTYDRHGRVGARESKNALLQAARYHKESRMKPAINQEVFMLDKGEVII